ncbi:MAG: hypothetical protein KGL53_13920 [Elusimicrobia bacterium]|nr:hypothetical protein [Elusimicrobiota bacterium]
MTAFSALSRLVRRLPEPAARFLLEDVVVRGLMMGWPANRRAARKNLTRVLAATGREASPAELAAMTRRSLALYARFLLLMAVHPAEVRAARERTDLVLLPTLKALGAEKRGVVLVTPNYGLVAHGLWALYEAGVPLRMPILNRAFLAHAPRGMYERVSTVGASASDCLRALAAEEVVFQIADINFLPRRRTVEFFGAPAPLGYAAARLSAASGAPILPAFATAEGDRCVFECDEPIRPQGLSLPELHRAVAGSMERFIGRHPDQWLVYDDFWDVRGMDRKYALVRRLAPWS